MLLLNYFPRRTPSSYHTSFHIASTGSVPVWSEILTTKSSDKPHPHFPRNRLRRFRGKWDVGGLLGSRQILSPSGTSPEEDFYDKAQPHQTIKLKVLRARRKNLKLTGGIYRT